MLDITRIFCERSEEPRESILVVEKIVANEYIRVLMLFMAIQADEQRFN